MSLVRSSEAHCSATCDESMSPLKVSFAFNLRSRFFSQSLLNKIRSLSSEGAVKSSKRLTTTSSPNQLRSPPDRLLNLMRLAESEAKSLNSQPV